LPVEDFRIKPTEDRARRACRWRLDPPAAQLQAVERNPVTSDGGLRRCRPTRSCADRFRNQQSSRERSRIECLPN
jgi:hypothetical protein